MFELILSVSALVLVLSVPLTTVLEAIARSRERRADVLVAQLRTLDRQMAVASEELANVRDGTSSPAAATQTLEQIRRIGAGGR